MHKVIFNCRSELIQHKHVDEQVHHAAMQKNRGDETMVFLVSGFLVGVVHEFVKHIPVVESRPGYQHGNDDEDKR